MSRKTIRRVKSVHINVHPDFYNMLERERRKFEAKTGINLRQTQMTQILSKMNLKFPTVGEDLRSAIKKRNNKKQKR